MPHFVIDCSEDILKTIEPKSIIDNVLSSAEDTELFGKGDVKVRIVPFDKYTCGGTDKSFLHVTADIMGGRTSEQKANLSKKVIENLAPLLPGVEFVSIDIRDIDPDTYTNLAKL